MKLVVNSCDGAYDSLDVRFTKDCDNACSFCIERTGAPSFGDTDVKKLIESTKQSGIKSILIVGGEPFLYPGALLRYIIGIRNHVDKIYITTSLPDTFNSQYPYCLSIINMITGLNVSIQDSMSEVNNNLLNASSRHNRLDILKSLNVTHPKKIRVSINLVKGGIDTWASMMRVVWMLENYGCLNIKINELQHSPLYVSYEKICNVRLKPAYASGCWTTVQLPMCASNIMLKRSCFKVEEQCKASILDLLKSITTLFYKKKNKFMVLYENGLLTNGWINGRNNKINQ